MNNQVQIKLIIDGKEANQVINTTKEALKGLSGVNIPLKEIPNTQIYSSLKNELLGATASLEELTEATSEYIQMNNLSANNINELLSKLEAEQRQVAITSAEYKHYQTAIEAVRGSTSRFGNNMTPVVAQGNMMSGSVNKMNQALGGLGWVLGDANMFMVDFRMGMMSIGNNIPMVVQQFQYLRQEMKGTGVSIKDVLVKSITGAGGLMLGINALMLAMQVVPEVIDKMNESATRASAEGLAELNKEIDKLTRADIEGQLSQVRTEIAEIEAELALAGAYSGVWSVGLTGKLYGWLTGADKKLENYNKQKELLEGKEKELEAKSKTLLGNIELKIEELRIQQNKLPDTKESVEQARNLEKQIDALEKRRSGILGQNNASDGPGWLQERGEYLAKIREEQEQEEYDSKVRFNDSIIKLEQEKTDAIARINQINLVEIPTAKTEAEFGRLKSEAEFLKRNISVLNEQLNRIRIDSKNKLGQMEDGSVMPKGFIAPDGDYKKPTLEFQDQTTEEITKANFQLNTMWNLSESVSTGLQTATQSAISFGMQSIRVFQNANSVLQVFINSLVQAVIETIALKTAQSLISLATGGAGGIFSSLFGMISGGGGGGTSAPATPAPAAANGAIVTKPTFMLVGEGREPEGVFPLSYLKNIAVSTGSQNVNIQLNPVELRANGFDLRAIIKKADKYVEKKY